MRSFLAGSLLGFIISLAVFKANCPVHCNDGAGPLSNEAISTLDASHTSEPMSINDRMLLSRLSSIGKKLLDDGATVEVSKLISELGTGTCELKLPSLQGSVAEPHEIYDRAKKSVVIIGSMYKCNKCTRWHASTASGFVIVSSGVIVTNYHVVNNPDKKTLIAMTSQGRVYPVKKVLAASESDDLAILQLDAKGLQPLPIASSRSAAPIGSTVNVISHPGRRFYSYTNGVVSRYLKSYNKRRATDLFAITADYARGSSGAPVLNQKGEVVGIVKSTESIYSSPDGGKQKHIQMVLKICVPSESLFKLIAPRRGGEVAKDDRS